MRGCDEFEKCRLRHRGPDWSGLHCHDDCFLAHQRLAIVDPTSGDQPLYNEDKTVIVTVCVFCGHYKIYLHILGIFVSLENVLFLFSGQGYRGCTYMISMQCF